MKRALAAAAIAMLLMSSVARAAERAKSSVSPAVELSRFIMPEENWKLTIEGMAAQLKQMAEAAVKQNGTEPPPDALAGMTKELMTYEELIDISASIFAKHYTDTELKQLLAFYRTPLGQKMIRLQPEIMQDVNGQMMLLVQQRLPSIMEKLRRSSPKP